MRSLKSVSKIQTEPYSNGSKKENNSMIRFPDNVKVRLSEYQCPECNNEFWVSYDPRIRMICPFCGDKAENVGDIMVYRKKITEKDI